MPLRPQHKVPPHGLTLDPTGKVAIPNVIGVTQLRELRLGMG